MDVDDLTRTPLSPTQRRNRLLLQLHREANGNAQASPEARAAALAQIRADLEHRRGERERTYGRRPPPPTADNDQPEDQDDQREI